MNYIDKYKPIIPPTPLCHFTFSIAGLLRMSLMRPNTIRRMLLSLSLITSCM